LVLLFY